MAGSTATCAGSDDCEIIGGSLGVYPGTSYTGNFAGDFVGELSSMHDSAACAENGLAAWKAGIAMTTGTPMLAEMGGVTFAPGVYIHESSINHALGVLLEMPQVYLDADGDKDAVFIFNVGTTLTTCAGSEIVLLNGAKAENVFWVLGTGLTMGADSTLVGNVLAGSAITIGTNAKIVGRAIAQTAVTCETACAIKTSGRHSAAPSAVPSAGPSSSPSSAPSASPSGSPSSRPSSSPSGAPSSTPSASPSTEPSASPSAKPSSLPSSEPSAVPSAGPSSSPSSAPSASPSGSPSSRPSSSPSGAPSSTPSASPSTEPSASPSAEPSSLPSSEPSAVPSAGPSSSPSSAPVQTRSVSPSAFMESMVVEGVTDLDNWTTVPLEKTYVSPIVVCTVDYGDIFNNLLLPAVVRMKDVGSTSFDIKLQNPNGDALESDGRDVHCVVVEEGSWQMPDGRNIEANKYESTSTDGRRTVWIGEEQDYTNSYSSPIVLGQVMSYIDERWSVFWSRGSNRGEAPNSSFFFTGKHAGEVSTTRNDEIVGYIVIEAGHATSGGIEIETSRFLLVDQVYRTKKVTHEFDTAFIEKPAVAVLSQVGMKGTDGSWAISAGIVSNEFMEVALDEDRVNDNDGGHVTEEVEYIVFSKEGPVQLLEAESE
jgi:hypothetical protein